MRIARAPVCAKPAVESSWTVENHSEVRPVEATLHPVLVADVGEAARDFLEGVAIAQGLAFVPLLAPPASPSLHVLEIHASKREPLLVFAEPYGSPTREGFPLRLKPIVPVSADEVATIDEPVEMPDSEARPRNENGPRSALSLVGRTLAEDRLEITALAGVGGAGAVYRAVHRALGIPLAVKILHESFQTDVEFCRRFHAEALSASRLDHVNVVRVTDFGQEPDGLLYIAMEYLDGVTLSSIVEREAPLPTARIVSIMSQVLAALAHAHARGIVHRDVKPDNVVLVQSRDDEDVACERVKVCDFGIAVPAFDARSARTIAGTPHYMSPEQVTGEPLDGRSDVYACGVMLYELATGRVPFGEGDARTIATCHVRVPPTPPSALASIDPALEKIILRALAKDPNARYENARELRNALRALVGDEAVPPSSRNPAPRPAPPVLRAATSPAEPDWLERGSDALVSAMTSSMSMRAVAPEIVTNTERWLERWAQAKSDEFNAMGLELEAALPSLLASRNVKALVALRTTLELLASVSDTRATCAVRILQKCR